MRSSTGYLRGRGAVSPSLWLAACPRRRRRRRRCCWCWRRRYCSWRRARAPAGAARAKSTTRPRPPPPLPPPPHPTRRASSSCGTTHGGTARPTTSGSTDAAARWFRDRKRISRKSATEP